MHTSIKLDTPCEVINLRPLNPLISKCQIKVCYVGEEPNRNGSIITKEVARKMADSLPGSPIVGFYNETLEDFEGHNRIIDISNGKMEFKDTTRPYGFVDLGARAWFQKFDDDGVEHEYLMTEGYLWTGQYPEAKRILDRGNNQSMELENVDGYWAEDENGEMDFFIINEAVISKLCILGEDVEPCFEGARITQVQFSFDDSFKTAWDQLVEQVYEMINKGGTPVEDKKLEIQEEEAIEAPAEIKEEEEAKAEDPAEEEISEEEAGEAEEVEAPKAEEVPDEEEAAEEAAPAEEAEPVEEPVVQYKLEEIPEYVELQNKYSALESKVAELEAFKSQIERKEKEDMIDSFYMLSDDDKKEVKENIDSYSLDDIEAKLSIICVRNRVSFNLESESEKTPNMVFNVNSVDSDDDSVPAWIKAVQSYTDKHK